MNTLSKNENVLLVHVLKGKMEAGGVKFDTSRVAHFGSNLGPIWGHFEGSNWVQFTTKLTLKVS